MTINSRWLISIAAVAAGAALAQPEAPEAEVVLHDGNACASWLDQKTGKLHSEEQLDLCALTAGKAVLIVNTASHCGYTPQFKGLEALYQRYREQGLVVLGFPSDDFFQEADDEADTANVCYVNYGVTFPMASVVRVRGSDAHPVFRHLHQAGQPSWNFNKYLVGRDGAVIEHFGSNTGPDAEELLGAIELALQEPVR
jgi:glutathione peroxidase